MNDSECDCLTDQLIEYTCSQLIGVSASTHALLLSTQYQHMGNTVVSECSLMVTVCQSAVND